jgi:hypothetical protein
MKIKAIILSASLAFLATFAHAKTCNINERTLKGAWLAANDHAAFEQMEFSTESAQSVFNSWLHDRPEIMGGTWSLKHCNLRISHPTEPNLTYNFTVRLNRGKLELKEEGSPVGKFRRIKN